MWSRESSRDGAVRTRRWPVASNRLLLNSTGREVALKMGAPLKRRN